jgi:hypothetical protein
MDIIPANVTRALTLELIEAGGAATPLDAVLSYDASDPYAVAARFTVAGNTVRWVFARSLLATGVFEPAGEGDVQVWPCLNARGQAVTVIELSSPEGQALIQARSDEVYEFLRRAEALVAEGAEATYIDIDGTIAKLLG